MLGAQFGTEGFSARLQDWNQQFNVDKATMVFESEKLRDAYRGVYKEAAVYGTGLHENLVGTSIRDIYLDEAAPISQEAYDALKPEAPCPVAPPAPKPPTNMWYAKENLPATCEYSPDFLRKVSCLKPHQWPTKGGSENIKDMDVSHLRGTMNKIERSWPNESKCPQRIAAAHSRIRRQLNRH